MSLPADMGSNNLLRAGQLVTGAEKTAAMNQTVVEKLSRLRFIDAARFVSCFIHDCILCTRDSSDCVCLTWSVGM